MTKQFYITTAIPYSNGAPHIGHAYEAVATDALARFKRLDGYKVHFLTGMDDHGQKIQQTAEKEGIQPQQLVDRVAEQFAGMRQLFNISHDDVIRTTEPRHKRAAQEFWQKMQERGDIYLDKYAGWYSVRDEAYFQEDELTVNADGQKLSPTGAPVNWMEEESYFFKLSAYQDRLLALYEAQPDFIGPDARRNEVVSFVKSGLKDLSVSRTSFSWGIPVPGDAKHVMYVWVDALSNYITALGYPNADGLMKDFWPCDVHMIGKDIIRFHCVYWPAFLMSAGLALPKSVFAHGFIYNRGEKMSKSVGNVITPQELATRYGVDQIRYFLLREIAYGQDGNISHEAIVQRMDSDLANGIGNLAQRSLSMINKNCNGQVPTPGPMTEADHEIRGLADALLPQVRAAVDAKQFNKALDAIWAVIGAGDRYFAGHEPWALKKTDPVRMGSVLYHTAEVVRRIALVCQPFMPHSMDKLLDQLGVADDQRHFTALQATIALVPGTILPAPAGVFPRFVEPETGVA